MEREQFQQKLMKRALEQGFQHCEVYFESAKNFEVLVLEGEVSHYENSSQIGICSVSDISNNDNVNIFP